VLSVFLMILMMAMVAFAVEHRLSVREVRNELQTVGGVPAADWRFAGTW